MPAPQPVLRTEGHALPGIDGSVLVLLVVMPELPRARLPTFSPLPPFVLLSGYQASLQPLQCSSLAGHYGRLGPHSLPLGSYKTLAFLEGGRCGEGEEGIFLLPCLRRSHVVWPWKGPSWVAQPSLFYLKTAVYSPRAMPWPLTPPPLACQLGPRARLLLCCLFLDARTVAS